MADAVPVDMEDMLAARERRSRAVRELLGKDPEGGLAHLTLNIPGPYKTFPLARRFFRSACLCLERELDLFGTAFERGEMAFLDTGDEGYWRIAGAPAGIKGIAMRIEDEHPLGRLMDIDIFDAAGIKISRIDMHRPSRGCLVCGAPSRLCARSRAHSAEELAWRVVELLRTYFPAPGSE